MIQSKGLDAENLGLQTMLFYNTDIGLIGGSSDEVTSNPNQSSDTFAFVNRIALLYKTVDGGKHWKALKFGDGYFNQLIQVKNKTFAIKKSKDNLHTTVYSSVNMGESWEECKSFPEGAYNFFGINNTLIAIATQDRVLTHVYLSKYLKNYEKSKINFMIRW